MEASSSQSSELDEESIILLQLLDVFGSRISLREIASAFCKAGRDPNLTYDILCQSKECISSSFTTHDSDGEVTGESSLELQSDNSEEELKCAKGFPKASKSKRCSVSAGSISSILGKSYSRSTVKQKGSPKTTKPLKLNVNKLPMSEPRGNGISLDSAIRTDSLHQDVEDFLYKMLGSGFQLGKDVIHEVLGSCGYDAKKSMDKLVDMSASTLIKSDDIVGSSYENFTDTHPNLASPLRKENSQDMHEAPRNGTELFRQSKEKYNLQKELLNSLFSVSERVEVVHKRIQPVRAVKLIKGVRDRVVAEPLRDTSPERVTDILEPHQDTIEDVEEEEMYQVLRRAAKEHWITMKEYYKAAYDAYASGDLTRADKLLEQGQFYNNKAREADEKSAQKTLECRKSEAQDEVTIDVHDQDAKGAIRLLKSHLTSLAGIPDQCLKVIVQTDAEDTSKRSLKRLVLKLLEKESIRWTEEGNGGTILINVEDINPQQLSFYKSY